MKLINYRVYITSKDNQKRSKAIHFVSDLIVNLPRNYLNALEGNKVYFEAQKHHF